MAKRNLTENLRKGLAAEADRFKNADLALAAAAPPAQGIGAELSGPNAPTAAPAASRAVRTKTAKPTRPAKQSRASAEAPTAAKVSPIASSKKRMTQPDLPLQANNGRRTHPITVVLDDRELKLLRGLGMLAVTSGAMPRQNDSQVLRNLLEYAGRLKAVDQVAVLKAAPYVRPGPQKRVKA
jgi:hypothetical protein